MVNPLRRRRTVRRSQHGPASIVGTVDREPSVDALSRAIAGLRAEIAEERNLRRGRIGGLSRHLWANSSEINGLAARVRQLESHRDLQALELRAVRRAVSALEKGPDDVKGGALSLTTAKVGGPRKAA